MNRFFTIRAQGIRKATSSFPADYFSCFHFYHRAFTTPKNNGFTGFMHLC